MEKWPKIAIAALLCILTTGTRGQVHVPPAVQEMQGRYLEYFDESPRIKMYEITLFLTRNRRELETQLQRAKSLFPQMQLDWVYEQPYYYLRTGRYLNEKQVWPDLYVIRKQYPNAIKSTKLITAEEYFED